MSTIPRQTNKNQTRPDPHMKKTLDMPKSAKRQIIGIAIFIGAIGLMLALLGPGSGITDEQDHPIMAAQAPDSFAEPENAGIDIPMTDISDIDILDIDIPVIDNPRIYDQDDEGSIVTMYLTVRQGNAQDNTDHTWQEVNAYSVLYYIAMGIDRYAAEAILQIGDENGPIEGEYGYDAISANAFVHIRGNTTSESKQKSYKIMFKEGTGEWRGQTTLALNKHPYDGLRFRNKLCYDLIKDIPDMISMRTQFVHLYVKDETDSGIGAGFEDYGLFTQIEQPNKTFLSNHGLDENGHFYKVNFFEFFRYEDAIRLESDPDYDDKAFSAVLESKGNSDHSKLIAMLEALNDYSIPIEETFEEYFDADNFFTWLSFHILTLNTDTTNRNYYLYSPLNSKKFYFVTWDCDDAFRIQEKRLLSPRNVSMDEYFGYEQGISNYWGIVLFQRVLEKEQYRRMLDNKIHIVKSYLTRERIEELVGIYRRTTEKIAYSEPDAIYARVSHEQYIQLADTIPDEVDLAYEMYENSLTKPMPFYAGFVPSDDGATMSFSWDTAFSFDKLFITYTFELSRDIQFTDVIYTESGLVFPILDVETPPPGRYFYRITATDENGRSQRTLAYLSDSQFIVYEGVLCFDVMPDGVIRETLSLRDDKAVEEP